MIPFRSSGGGGLQVSERALELTKLASKFCGGALGAERHEVY